MAVILTLRSPATLSTLLIRNKTFLCQRHNSAPLLQRLKDLKAVYFFQQLIVGYAALSATTNVSKCTVYTHEKYVLIKCPNTMSNVHKINFPSHK